MVSLYYSLPKEKESDCEKFNLSVALIPGTLVPSFCLFLSYLMVFVLLLICFFYVSVNLFTKYFFLLQYERNQYINYHVMFVPPEKTNDDEKIYRLRIEVL